MVYKMALPQHVKIGVTTAASPALGLLCTSRQLREECQSILYRTSVFHISLDDMSSYDVFLEWIKMLGDEKVASIKALRIYAWLELWRIPIGQLEFSYVRLDIKWDTISGVYSCKYGVDDSFPARYYEETHARQVRGFGCDDHALANVVKVLRGLSRSNGEGRFKVADIAKIVDTTYKYSSLYNTAPDAFFWEYYWLGFF